MRMIKQTLADHRAVLTFLVGMVFLRSAIADWYSVPSGSMYPTVMIGDRIIAERFAYDLKVPFTDVVIAHIADPRRGDIVTFSSPEDGRRLIKRLVGLPGDTVELRNDVLTLNGVQASYATATGAVATHTTPDYQGRQVVLEERILGSQRSIMLMPGRTEARRNFGPMQVPRDHYLMLGDSRDNSLDSRYIGFIKRAAITGRVGRVAFSLDAERHFIPRLERFGASLMHADPP
ncbi:MAG: signal peptidase I [Bradyrhizobium sp.]|jgi:signal peptidase I